MSRTPPSRFATMFVAALQPDSHLFRYANAGQNPPLWISKAGESRWLHATGPPVALLDEPSYFEERRDLATGDLLVMYTDGVTEAASPDEVEFGEERLATVLAEHREDSAKEIIDAVLEKVDSWTARAPAEDDITLVVARRVAS